MLGPAQPKTQGEAIMQIHSAVRAIESKLDGLCTTNEEQDRRIGKLEQWKATVTGRLIVASASSSVAGLIAGWILKGAIGGVP
jgi:hypothetical protein